MFVFSFTPGVCFRDQVKTNDVNPVEIDQSHTPDVRPSSHRPQTPEEHRADLVSHFPSSTFFPTELSGCDEVVGFPSCSAQGGSLSRTERNELGLVVGGGAGGLLCVVCIIITVCSRGTEERI